MEINRKLRIGWFTFTCCEDSTIIFTELLNDHYQDWIKVLDIRHAKVLQTKNVLDELDVAFVEGAIISDDQVPRLREIRERSKKLIAVGACAILGKPSSQRNDFSTEQIEQIQPILERFNYAEKVRHLDEVVTVDDTIPGCPMAEQTFMTKLQGLLDEFNIIKK